MKPKKSLSNATMKVSNMEKNNQHLIVSGEKLKRTLEELLLLLPLEKDILTYEFLPQMLIMRVGSINIYL